MRTQQIVLSLAIATGAFSSAYAEEYRGTWEQQMACTPDVMRLCGDKIPDVNRIVACLRQNTASLGNSCRAVFESNASEQQQANRAPPSRVPQQQQQQVAPRARAGQPLQPTQPRSPYEDDE
jgi:hypothetical protein